MQYTASSIYIMGHQCTMFLVILSIAFAFTFIGNFLLAVMIVKLKRQEERETSDRRRHFDVLFTALAVGDAVGSCLNYPILLHLYHLASEEKEISMDLCRILISSAGFYFSFIAILTMMMNLHNFASTTWPFQYFIYLRRKRSKIPIFCVVFSLFIALVSLALSASRLSLFNLIPGKYLGVPTCIPDMSFSVNTASKYYYFIIGQLSFWTNFLFFIFATRHYVKMRENSVGRIGGIHWLGLPDGAWFTITFKLIYLTFWTPFIVAMTIVTCSSYQIPTDVLVTVCYLVFLPGLIGPFIYYITHQDLRDVFNTAIKNLLSRGQSRERVNNEEIELQN